MILFLFDDSGIILTIVTTYKDKTEGIRLLTTENISARDKNIIERVNKPSPMAVIDNFIISPLFTVKVAKLYISDILTSLGIDSDFYLWSYEGNVEFSGTR